MSYPSREWHERQAELEEGLEVTAGNPNAPVPPMEILRVAWQMEVDRRKEVEADLRDVCAAANRLLDGLNEKGNDAAAICDATQALGDALHAAEKGSALPREEEVNMLDVRRPNFRLFSVGHRMPRRLYLFRLCWQRSGAQMDGREPLRQLSAALLFEPRDLWVGAYWTRDGTWDWFLYLCLVPCLPLRLHFNLSWGTGGIA